MPFEATLAGKTIIVTRPLAQAQNILQTLEAQLATTVHFPTISINPCKDVSVAKQCFENLCAYQIIFFISANAVHFAMNIMQELKVDLKQHKLAAVGPATKAALRNFGYEIPICPQAEFTSEVLLEDPALRDLTKQNVLIVRGSSGREYLRQVLESRGANVEYAAVYDRMLPENRNPIDLSQLPQADTAVLLYSAESAQNLWSLCSDDEQKWLTKVTYIAGSKRIAEAATRVGFANNPIIAENPSDQAILTALVNWP